MNDLKTYYYIPNIWKRDELNVDYAFEFKSNRDIVAVTEGHKYDDFELSWLVEDMAKDFFHNHDGYEIGNEWCGDSRDFAVWDSDKNFLGTFEVVLEYEPAFSVWEKK